MSVSVQKIFSLKNFFALNLWYIFLFLLPWQTRYIFHEGVINGGYFEYGTFSVYATDVLFVIILVWVMIKNSFDTFDGAKEAPLSVNPEQVLAFRPESRRVDKKTSVSFAWLIISLFEMWVFVSLFWAKDFGISLYAYMRVLQGIGIIYLVSQKYFSFEKMRLALIIAAVMQSFMALVQFSMQEIFSSKWLGLASHQAFEAGTFVVQNDFGRWLRSYGSFSHPNILGGFLALAFLLLISYYYRPLLKQSYRITVFAGTLVLLLGLVLTFSKSAVLGALVGMGIFLLTKTKDVRIRHRMYVGGVLVFIFLLSLIYREQIINRILGQESLEVASQKERLTQYEEAMGLMMWHPVRGYGVGQYATSVYNEIDSARASFEYQPVHNLYLLIGVELGLVGLFLFFIFIAFSTPFFQRKLYALSPINYALLSAVLVIGLFDHYLWSLQSGRLMLFLVVGFLYRCSSKGF